MFRRRRKQEGSAAADEVEAERAEVQGSGEDAEQPEPEAPAQSRAERAGVSRENGPYDITEVEDPGAGGRVDLGGLWMPGLAGMELRVELDEQTQAVVSVAAVIGEAAVQVQAFAAPRSEGVWGDVRREIGEGIRSQGGRTAEAEGPFGTELRAEMPVPLPDGRVGAQAARFVGVDGPRWFLRGVLTGRAAIDPAAAAPLEHLFRNVVVVRGKEAMAPRELIPLRLPEQAPSAEGESLDGQPQEADLNPFERGPEITEVR